MPHYDVTPEQPHPPLGRSPLLGFVVAAGVASMFADGVVRLGPTVESVVGCMLCAAIAAWIAVRQLPRWLRTRRTAR